MIFGGIDPGQTGGIALLFPDNSVEVYPYTSTKLIDICKCLVDSNSSVCVAVEKVHAMPHQGVSSTFNFGMGFGRILGILEALNISYELVTPQTWKKYIGVTHDKKTSIRKAQFLYPEVSLLPTKRCRVPNDGMAEALLIAHYLKAIHRDESIFKGDEPNSLQIIGRWL